MPRSQFSVTALIPAAGASSRMGGGSSKALLEFDGSTAIQRVVAEIFASDYVRRFIVLAPAEALPVFKALSFGAAQVRVELGGATRQESVQKGLQYICEEEVTPDFVLVHDAARCLLSRQLVEATIEAAFTYKAVTAAVPLVDSLVRVDRSNQQGTSIDREGLWAVQTPQVFAFDLLQAAHAQNRSGATDDASLVEHLHPVRIVEGARENFKLTTPFDVRVARSLLEKP